METYAENHREGLDATHVGGLEIALMNGQDRVSSHDLQWTKVTYNADEPLVLHLLDRNVVNEARDNGSRASLFAEVDLLSDDGSCENRSNNSVETAVLTST